MKKLFIVLFAILLIIFICDIFFFNKSEIYIGNWRETELPFSEAIEFKENNELLEIIGSEKYFNNTKRYDWLRSNENLSRFYSIIKKIGVDKFISKSSYNDKAFEDKYWGKDWEGMSINDVVKTLIISYEFNADSLSYYKKFWNRRVKEGNEKIVFDILKDLDNHFNSGITSEVNKNLSNDTLYNLINFNVLLNLSDSSNKNLRVLNYFNYLKNTGLEHSAYNLIFKLRVTEFVNLNKDSLLNTLSFDTINYEEFINLENANWIKRFNDIGP